MFALLFPFFLAGILLPSEAAPTFVQRNSNNVANGLSGCLNVSFGGAFAAAGNVVFLGVDFVLPSGADIPVTVTDDAGASYTDVVSPYINTNAVAQHLFWSGSLSSARSLWTICVAQGVQTGNFNWRLLEYSGVLGVDATSKSSNEAETSSTKFQSAPATATCTDDIALAYCIPIVDAVMVPHGFPYTVEDTTSNTFFLDTPVTSTGPFSVTGQMGSKGTGWAMLLVLLQGTSCPLVVGNVPAGQTVNINGNALVQLGQISGTVTVSGNLTIASGSTFNSGCSFHVSGNAVITAQVSFAQGATLQVDGALALSPGAVVTPIVTSLSSGTNNIVITVASCASLVGRVSLNSAVISAPLPTGQCVQQVSTPTPNYGLTSLTVTVSVVVQPCSTSPLSTAAIIGIAVGGGVFLLTIIIITTVLLVKRYKDKKNWDSVQNKIQSMTSV